MSFRLVPKSVTLIDLERRNGSYFALLLIFTELVILGAYCVKVFDKAIGACNYGQFTITMSSSKRLQRDVRRPRYKFLADS